MKPKILKIRPNRNRISHSYSFTPIPGGLYQVARQLSLRVASVEAAYWIHFEQVTCIDPWNVTGSKRALRVITLGWLLFPFCQKNTSLVRVVPLDIKRNQMLERVTASSSLYLCGQEPNLRCYKPLRLQGCLLEQSSWQKLIDTMTDAKQYFLNYLLGE